MCFKINQAAIAQKLFPGCQIVDNYEHARLGKIWIMHDDAIRLSIHSSSGQAIHCHLFPTKVHRYFFLSVAYASNNGIERRS